MRLGRLAPLALAACATLGGAPAPEAPARAAELARVRCLLLAPLENVSDVGLGAEAAMGAAVAGIDPDRTRVYPVRELRALFRDTPLELPEGIPPSLALELAEILGADAALYGAVEGRSRGGERTLQVTLRLAMAGTRDLVFSVTVDVEPGPGESPEAAVRRAVEAATRPALSHLGSPPAPRECYDPARFARLRSLAKGQAARTPPPATAAPDPTPAAAAAPQPAGGPPARAVPPRSPRQAEWARRLARHERFVVEGVNFEGRSPRLVKTAGLADLAGALSAAPEVNVRLEAYVDATADPDRDARLSMQMAQAVGQKLVEMGVIKERVFWAGRAGEKPILPNFTARGRAANRRIEAVGLK